MLVNERILKQVGLDVCHSMLELQSAPFTVTSSSVHHQLVASVEIRSEFQRSLDVIADEELATTIAEVMFASGRAELTPSDIRDALGEIANMIGGNLKGILGEEAELSLPIVSDAGTSSRTDDAHDVRTTIDCGGCPLTIVLRAPTVRLPRVVTFSSKM